MFEQQTGLPRSYAVLGFGVVYIVIIFLNIAGIGQLLSNVAGFVIPGYFSLIALETRSKDDDTQLLTYWVVFAFLNVIEFWSRAILYWVPFYFFLKTIFLIYIGVPAFGGARIIYANVIRPFSKAYIVKLGGVKSSVNDAAEGVSTSVGL
uniref:Protein YOP1 n=1 Tax=Candidozyma auris TaxID=498019 RepID=A0A0L0NZH7_CANAR